MRRHLLSSVSLAIIVASGTAHANPLDPATLLGTYNLITSGNATSNGDIEGQMLVGGNFTGAAGTANLYNFFARVPVNKLGFVYGDNTSQINVDNGGSLYIGGANHGAINLNGAGSLQIVGNNTGNINGGSGGVIAIGGTAGGTINQNGDTLLHPNTTTIVPPLAISNVVSALTSYSATLAALASNGTITAAPNTLTFSHAGPGQSVFDITGAQLAADLVNANIAFALGDPNAPVIVNVDLEHSSFSEPSSAHFPGTQFQNVLFNFFNGPGTTLSFSTQWETSILAMGSTVTNSTSIEGAVAAASFVGYGELHNFPLNFPPGQENPPPNVPEPASLAMLLAGLIGLWGWTIRPRKSAG